MSNVSLRIDIDENNLCSIIRNINGVKQEKVTTVNVLCELLKASLEEAKNKEDVGPVFTSNILPNYSNEIEKYRIIQTKTFYLNNSCWYIILRKNIPADFFILGENTYRNIGMPYTLFAIKVYNNKCVNIKIVCTKTNEINDTSYIYTFPFSNVGSYGNVCLGGNSLTNYDLSNLNKIFTLPEMFLSMPNSSHSYENGNSFKGSYEEFLVSLENKEFNDNYLVKSYFKSYKDFINSLS